MSATLPRARPGRAWCIRLPNGAQCSVAVYVASWRSVKALPADARVKGWDHFATDAGRILRDLRGSIHDRINRHLPWPQDGRKWAPIWQADMRRAARDLNHPRLVIHWLPPELRERFGHRLRDPADYR